MIARMNLASGSHNDTIDTLQVRHESDIGDNP
jgi:hypothetical protein